MTTFNSSLYVGAQIESIYKQTYKNWHIYVSDDASSDNTRSILNKLSKKNRDITVISNKTNVGVGRNFEIGLRKINNEPLIAVCDSDDIWLPTKLENLVKYMLENNSVILVHHDAEIVDENLKKIGQSLWSKLLSAQVRPNELNHPKISSLLEKNYISGSTMLFRSKLIKKLEPFPIGVVQDYWIALVSCTAGKIGAIDKNLMLYRQHSNSLQGASVRKIDFYIKRLFSKSYNISYMTEAENNIKAMQRLLELKPDEYQKVSIVQRQSQYEIILKLLRAKGLRKIRAFLDALKHLITSESNYYRFIIIFFSVNAIISFRK